MTVWGEGRREGREVGGGQRTEGDRGNMELPKDQLDPGGIDWC